MKQITGISIIALSALLSTACAKNSSPATAPAEDTSTSGSVAGAIGGALSSSSSSGSVAMKKSPDFLNQSINTALSSFLPSALAANVCPSFATTTAGCTASTTNLWLSYGACSFGGSSATWTGSQLLSMSSGTATCGTFPNPGASGTLLRQFVTGINTTPGSATRTSPSGVAVTVDDASPNLSNFDSQTIPAIANGGYGTQVGFDASGKRNSLTIARRVYAVGRFDHTIQGNLTVTEASAIAGSRTLSGQIKVYHNGAKVIATSTFNSVTHSNTCCVPVSGNITTAFTAGAVAAPTSLGAAIVGRSEILTFTGCGTATLQAPDGSSSNVTLGHCF